MKHVNEQKYNEILEFTRTYIRENGISPSVREICTGTNTSSTSTVHKYLHKLKEDGKIHMNQGKNRTIVISEKRGIPVIREMQDFLEIKNPENALHYFDSDCLTGENYLIACCQKDLEMLQIHKGDFLLTEHSEQGEYLVILDETGEISVTHRKEFRSGQIVGSLVMVMRKFAEIPEQFIYRSEELSCTE
ncbi:MAG: hypothetical protein K2O42_11205 [Oscillospiraceae bacterium]|nr:hypothetical protein [Oscillospiraceae bacterium]